MKIVKYFLALLIIISAAGCTFNFLDSGDGEEGTAPPDYSVWDNQEDTLHYYNGNDSLLWSENYDYNDAGQCIFLEHLLPSGTPLWSCLYGWGTDGVEVEACFDENNELTRYTRFIYTGGKLSAQIRYNSTDILQWVKIYDYSGDLVNEIASFDTGLKLQWAYRYEYTGLNRIKSTAYDSEGTRSEYIDYVWDSEDRLIKKTGYGSSTSGSGHNGNFGGFDFRASGGVNTVNRNDSGLLLPAQYPPFSPPARPVLTDVSGDTYSWMMMWAWAEYGGASLATMTTLNENYLPVYMKTSVPGTLDGDVEVELSYTGTRLDKKTTSYNGEAILNIDFGWDSGYLTSLNTTGRALYFPALYKLSYDEVNNLPRGVEIWNGETLVQRFEYVFSGDLSSIDSESFAKSQLTINHYNGDDVLIEYFVFGYNVTDDEVTITVMNPNDTPLNTGDDTANGSYVIYYNADSTTAGVASFDRSGVQIWNYDYSYNDAMKRISEIKLDKDDIPEVINTFDINSFLEDVRRFMP